MFSVARDIACKKGKKPKKMINKQRKKPLVVSGSGCTNVVYCIYNRYLLLQCVEVPEMQLFVIESGTTCLL